MFCFIILNGSSFKRFKALSNFIIYLPESAFLKRKMLENTVEQEIIVTGNFRDFRPQAIRVEEIFANFQLAEVLMFPTVYR